VGALRAHKSARSKSDSGSSVAANWWPPCPRLAVEAVVVDDPVLPDPVLPDPVLPDPVPVVGGEVVPLCVPLPPTFVGGVVVCGLLVGLPPVSCVPSANSYRSRWVSAFTNT
jgi:hypothetical protein